MEKGKLIILEGLDACGKDTQADLMVERLGWVKRRLPEYSSFTGKMIEKMKNNGKKGVSEEYFQTIMLANYIDEFENHIIPMLEQGQNVVMTRAWLSMRAYSYAFGASEDYINRITQGFQDWMYDKDIDCRCVLIDIPVHVAMQRVEKRGGKEAIFENYDTLNKVKEYFDRNVSTSVDGTAPIESVYADLVVLASDSDGKTYCKRW